MQRRYASTEQDEKRATVSLNGHTNGVPQTTPKLKRKFCSIGMIIKMIFALIFILSFLVLYLGISVAHKNKTVINNSNNAIQSSMNSKNNEGTANSNISSIRFHSNSNNNGKADNEDDNENNNIIMVFSTGCSTFQDWQSYMFFYHAMNVKQPGQVVRIVSGCDPQEEETLQKLHDKTIKNSMSSNFHIHFTPDFSGPNHYKYYNKPYGLKHFMENYLHYSPTENSNIYDDYVIILVDPDQVLLRPMNGDFRNETHILVHGGPARKRPPPKKEFYVKHGRPAASMYGFYRQPFTKVNISNVAGPDSPALNVSNTDQIAHYPAGPPYLATCKDMYDIALKWTEFVPLVHKEYHHLLAEMFAYSIAAAHLQLPHVIVKSFMVSDMLSPEAWDVIDKSKPSDICYNPPTPKDAGPFVLHYCHGYGLGNYLISKYTFSKKFLSCEHPLLVEPESDIAVKYNYQMKRGEKKVIKNPKHILRQTYMFCRLVSLLNMAGTYYKDTQCIDSDGNNYANYEKTHTYEVKK